MRGLPAVIAAAFLAVYACFTQQGSLAAAPIINKKVSVSEVSFDSHIEDLQWCGDDHRTILLKTRKGRLYRSKDGGKTWMEITDLLKTDDSGSGTAIAVDSIMISPVNKSIIVIVGTHRNHFVSEDAGVTFRKIKYTSTIHNFHFHPTRASYALLSTWTDPCYSKTGSRRGEECNHQLYYTADLGRTFQLVGEYVVQFSWGDKKIGVEDNIYFTQHRGKSGDQPRYGGWSKNVDLMVTKDFGRSVNRLVYRGNKFLLSNGYFFVAKVRDAVKQTVTLLVSTDGGTTFAAAKLPVEIEEKSYTVLDTSEGAIMLHVNHGGEAGRDTGNVYISDANGIRFSLSLPNNIRAGTGECEFDKVLSMEGVYIANFKDTIDPAPAGASNAQEDLTEQEEEAEGIQSEVEKKHQKVTNRARREEVTRTAISFDKGGVWSYIKAPKVDSRGQKIDCPPDSCWLHLNGITKFNEFAPFYSVENAIGIIMGTGNVGSYLRSEKEEVNTYLSRDGGLTWIEAHKGAFIYEMGDHGGLLVMADDTKKTNQVVFSWNEGQSWYDFELGSAPLFVDNIVIEPQSSSVEFLLYGKRENDNADKEDVAAAAACTSSAFFYTAAYRKVPGDVCEGGWKPEKVAVPCPPHSPVSRGGKLVLLLISLIVLLMCLFNYLAKTGRLKAFFRNTGFETFANVSYAIVGSGPSGWADEGSPQKSGRDAEEMGGRMRGTSKYEPELNFIDEEQDENEEDAPRLMSYGKTGFSNNQGSARDDDFELGEGGSSGACSPPRATVRTSRPPSPQGETSVPIPRLAPPGYGDKSLELL
ncbi:hypothetical protein ACSSS7_006552 [Eimeria intestinalis]